MTLCIAWLDMRDAEKLIADWARPEDHAHAAGRHPRTALDSLAARAALRCLAWRTTGIAVWQIQIAPTGKPFLLTIHGTPGPSISLSHSGRIVSAAIAPNVTALGIDVEQHKPRDFNVIAAHAFGPAERAQVIAEGADAFYRIWTAREARSKATGGGFAAVLDNGDRVGPGIGAGDWHWEEFYFQHRILPSSHSLTVATDTPIACRIESIAH